MNRRNFVKLSSLSLLPILACGPQGKKEEEVFSLKIHSDMRTGHLVRDSFNWPEVESEKTELLVVGAGIAGLSAAANAPTKDLLVCELSDRIGGSSGSETYQGLQFCQGAHYDLVYPNYFGKDCLNFFEKLNIIQFNGQTKLWEYTDKQYLIDTSFESQCFSGGAFRSDVLPEGEEVKMFLDFMDQHIGNFMLPSRAIPKNMRALNQIDFLSYLNKNITLSPGFVRAIDYQMIDDFSGEAHQVSALAGMYYYANRPYRTNEIEVFSPPQGNFYFANKIATEIDNSQILLKHLVKQIKPLKKGFEVLVADVSQQKVKKILAKHVIYAGQKHALKYIFPEEYPAFENIKYAPWLVVNYVLKENSLTEGHWQNEMVMNNQAFLGFIDSDAQHQKGDKRVLTAYFCFPEWQRKNLANLDRTGQQIALQTAEKIGWYFGLRPEQFVPMVEKVFIKAMGHAMPIPVPGYLFNDHNINRKHKNLAFAGVDNGRLPLLLEAVDSGLCAVNEIFGSIS